jgi:hydrogenase maturation protein HypF
MAEEGIEGKVIGVAFDGTGYGTDGNLWGGEFLVAGIEGFERAGQFRYIPLPGGESAIREPWRTAVSYILDAAGDEVMDYLEPLGFIDRYGRENIERVVKVCRAGDLAPLSSGAGRLFDAVSALIGLCDRNTYEGEAAIALEALIREGMDEDYPVNIVADRTMVIDFSPAVLAIVNDCAAGRDRREIATRFHNTVASVILRVVMRIGELHRMKDAALSGGTFQNRYLLDRTGALLQAAGMNVHTNKAVPCNDACISLGQAYLVRERMKRNG